MVALSFHRRPGLILTCSCEIPEVAASAKANYEPDKPDLKSFSLGNHSREEARRLFRPNKSVARCILIFSVDTEA